MSSRKSRIRSESAPIAPDSLRRKSSAEDLEERPLGGPAVSPTWTGSLKTLIWNLWSQTPGQGVEDTESGNESECNLSDYEEQVRRNRPLPSEPSRPPPSLLAIPSKHGPALSGSPTTAASPKSPSLYLSEMDYGIKLEMASGVAKKDLLMTEDLISRLHTGLPSRWRIASAWTMLYSTNLHGFSLATMFSRSRKFAGPVLCIVKDAAGSHFGAFATEPFLPHIGHFGTGECFLWRCERDGRVRRWRSSGLNDYYMLCEPGFLAVGCGEGRYGLWLDAQFEKGHSQPVPTFSNEPLSQTESFECVAFELWGLICEEA